ncbi:MAG: hypothetical protein J5493_08620 [Lachnospiraceae bacterium]|nr:hypothetical protein [Lachnospiraceae bacterium]
MLRFIVNPAARSWHGRECMEKIGKALDAAGIPYEAVETKAPRQVGILAEKLSGPDTEMLGVIGGDGTLNELVSGNTAAYSPIFYVPYGSGNDFARGIGLKVNEENAPALAVDHSSLTPKTVDIGFAHAKGQPARRFIVSGGIGFDAAVCWDLEKGGIKKALNKIHLGKLTYLVYGIKNLLTCPLAHGELILNDGEKTLPIRRLAFMSAQNLPYEGGGFYFAPKAVSHDGLIDLCIVTPRNHFMFIVYLACSLFQGAHLKRKRVTYIQCRSAKLKLDRPLYYHTDGEIGDAVDEIEFRTDPATIRVMQ